MDKVNVKTYLSNLTIPGAAARFYCRAATTRTISRDELCNIVASASGIPLSTVKYVNECINKELIEQLAKNCRVHTGLFVASLGIGGSLDSMQDQPNKLTNPVHAVLTPEGEIVDILRAIELVNVTETVQALLYELQEQGCPLLNTLTTPNASIALNGSNIAIDTTKTDEGIWLANTVTGALVKQATITETTSARAVFKFATLPDNGVYDLVVATRNNEAGMDVVTVSRRVNVETAA